MPNRQSASWRASHAPKPGFNARRAEELRVLTGSDSLTPGAQVFFACFEGRCAKIAWRSSDPQRNLAFNHPISPSQLLSTASMRTCYHVDPGRAGQRPAENHMP